MPQAASTEVKRLQREADNTPASSAIVKMSLPKYRDLPPYMASWCAQELHIPLFLLANTEICFIWVWNLVADLERGT